MRVDTFRAFALGASLGVIQFMKVKNGTRKLFFYISILAGN